MHGLTRDDGATIGFVASCLWSSAISAEELREWCSRLIRDHEVSDLPEYVFELMEFDGPPVKLAGVIGFEPGWRGTKRQEHALFGIALRRGRERYEWPVKKEVALRALAEHPEIESRFRELFPFVDLPTG